ncbi:hypothetical protein [Deinococcus petrolearius]|uniref:Uncharacterized protein n=1 Tax=Deinococcus petrolearius TaxID=1751295 RepID=A0ABW1DNP1_9DEIO
MSKTNTRTSITDKSKYSPSSDAMPSEVEYLSLEKISSEIQKADFHPQRLRIGLDAEPPRLHLPIEDWKEFYATAKALKSTVIFYVAEPLTDTDLIMGTGQKLIWKVLPEAKWLEEKIGHFPTVIYYAFFGSGVLEFRQDTTWWLGTESLWEQATEAVKQGDRQERQQQRQAFLAELQSVLPQDEVFRKIALLPRPPITEIRKRIIELFKDQRFIGSLNIEIQDIVKQVKLEHKLNKKNNGAN